jgi:hypothetical protein
MVDDGRNRALALRAQRRAQFGAVESLRSQCGDVDPGRCAMGSAQPFGCRVGFGLETEAATRIGFAGGEEILEAIGAPECIDALEDPEQCAGT